jgi:hypothetical protein
MANACRLLRTQSCISKECEALRHTMSDSFDVVDGSNTATSEKMLR